MISYSREYSWNTFRMRQRRTSTVSASLYAGMQMYSTKSLGGGGSRGRWRKLETWGATSHPCHYPSRILRFGIATGSWHCGRASAADIVDHVAGLSARYS